MTREGEGRDGCTGAAPFTHPTQGERCLVYAHGGKIHDVKELRRTSQSGEWPSRFGSTHGSTLQ